MPTNPPWKNPTFHPSQSKPPPLCRPPVRPPTNILASAQAGRFTLQDFTPLAYSLEWDLGTTYLLQRGSRAFLSDPIPVPFAVNNSGVLSRYAADLFFANLTAADQAGNLENEFLVLELGIGLGLFARFFLDAFRELCLRHGKDYYDRLTYVAGDHSERMLLDAARHGVLSGHSGHYLLRVVDALHPEPGLQDGLTLFGQPSRPIRAVFLNYLLDCLPVQVLRQEDEGLRQLCVRTCLARGVNLHEFTEDYPEDLTHLTSPLEISDRQRLLDLFGLFTSEYDYRPVASEAIPYNSFALPFLQAHKGTLVYSHGALTCLERLLGLLHPEGFILANDYGSAEDKGSEDFEHQRYTGSTFVGVNFALLKAFFADGGRCQWAEPKEESGRIYSRLLGHSLSPEVIGAFQERFTKASWDRLEEPVQKAKEHASQGRLEAAASAYHKALERQPDNWLLLCEVANFLNFGLRDPQAGLEMARAGLALNPSCSADLWNAYGDCLFSLGRIGESRHAFEQALQINPEDVAARYNLAWVFLHRKEHAKALEVIAEALAKDWRGEYRDRLLQKQTEVLVDLARRRRQEFQAVLDRVSHHPTPPARNPMKGETKLEVRPS